MNEIDEIDYNFYTDGNEDINVDWTGQYTIGRSYLRGTRVWLKTNTAITVSTDFLDEYEENEFYEGLENNNPTFRGCIKSE